MFKLETDVDKATRKLARLGSHGIPSVIANTLDNVAFAARTEANEQFEKDHVIRSNWTQRGTRFEKTRRNTTIARMESRVGSIRDYADELEQGGTIKPRKKFLMSPALAARGGNIRKRIKPAARLNVLHPFRPPKVKGGRRAQFAAMLNMARRDNLPGAFMVRGWDGFPDGIFKLGGAGWRKRGGGKIIMLRKIHTSATIRGHSFIRKGAEVAAADMARLYVRNANRMLRR